MERDLPISMGYTRDWVQTKRLIDIRTVKGNEPHIYWS